MHFYGLCALLIVANVCVQTVAGDIFVECSGIRDRTFVSSSKSCRHYIFCDGDDSYDGLCGEGDYFNEIYQTCDPEELVNCRIPSPGPIGPIGPAVISSPTTTTRTTLRTPAPAATNTPLRPTTAIIPANPVTTSSPSTFITPIIGFTTSNATAGSPTGVNTDIGDVPPGITTTCPVVDNPQRIVFLPHPKSCSDYFVCYHGEAIPMHCSATLHFDVRRGKCDYPQNARCQAKYSTPKEQCLPHTTDLYPHSGNCNYFYYCKNGFLLLQQCPFFYGWDFERRTCMALNKAKCFNNRKRV